MNLYRYTMNNLSFYVVAKDYGAAAERVEREYRDSEVTVIELMEKDVLIDN